jgi:Kdo2-lipid IVA lauroyltransferase/acyltransferase
VAKKKRSRAVDYAVYLVIRLLVAGVQAMPARWGYAVADAIAAGLFSFVRGRTRVARENVRAAFPAMPEVRVEATVRGMYRHFCRAFVDLMHLPRRLHVGNWRKHVALPEGGRTLPHLLGDRPALIVTAHFGNWEMAGFHLGLCGFRTFAIARVLDNPYLERFAKHFRQRTGQTIIAKNDDFARLNEALKAGGKVATLADQDAGPRGVFVDFFGRPASTHKAIALMAIEFDAVMAVIGVPRVSRADYAQRADFDPDAGLGPLFYAVKVADVIDPREYAGDPNAVKAITARYTSALERLIREHPEQYFWLHRRWKHQPKARADKKAA